MQRLEGEILLGGEAKSHAQQVCYVCPSCTEACAILLWHHIVLEQLVNGGLIHGFTGAVMLVSIALMWSIAEVFDFLRTLRHL
ncbi:hypothetical protein D1872_333850 [compost metagenome]